MLVPHQCPAEALEILGDVPFAPILAAPLDRYSVQALTPLPHSTIEDHVRGLAEYMLEIRVSRRLRARNDEEQTAHELPPRD
jgi:hypothetical protein